MVEKIELCAVTYSHAEVFKLAPKKKKYSRTDGKKGHKSLRVREKVQFAVEFWATFDGKSATAFIEEACEAMADAMAKEYKIEYRRKFHPNEGVRKLRVYLLQDYPLKDKDEMLRSFVMKHREFFYTENQGKMEVNIPNTEILWPRIEELARIDDPSDYWAAGRAMVAAIAAREVEPPAWPPK